MPRIFLIDGSGYIFRAFYAVRPLTKADGTPVNAVLGFTKMMLKLRKEKIKEDDYVAVVFDSGRETFRNAIYAEYKANRQETPLDLIPQFSLIRKATEALNMEAVEEKGFEADDIIATYAKMAKEEKLAVVVVSADKDLMQLMDEEHGITIYDALKERNLNKDDVKEKFGVEPKKVIEVQALMGDTSDNIPGVKGVGPKTAAKLIQEFHSVDELYHNLDKVDNVNLREKLRASEEMAKISYQLVKLSDNTTRHHTLEELKNKGIDYEKLQTFLEDMEFQSLLKTIQGQSKQKQNGQIAIKEEISSPLPENNIKGAYATIDTMEAWQAYRKKIEASKRIAIDTETTGLNAHKAELVGISISIAEGEGVYIPLSHKQESDTLMEEKIPIQQLAFSSIIDDLKTIGKNQAIVKIGHNIKYDTHILKRQGIILEPIEDTIVMSFCRWGGQFPHNMDDMAKRCLGYKTLSYDDVIKTIPSKHKTFDYVPIDKATVYAAEDADITLRLYNVLKQELENHEKLKKLYEDMEKPLIHVLTQMEEKGVMVDAKRLKELSMQFEQELENIAKKIHEEAGKEFNIASPAQLGEILFGSGELKGSKTQKTKAWKTTSDVLEKLRDEGNTLSGLVLQWRHYAKLKSTYTDALWESADKTTARVHTSFSQTLVNTGRLSSTKPNLQNIPIRHEDGMRIRRTFIAPKGHVLIGLDYSQIELRVLAHVANVAKLKEAFKTHQDIHTQTAAEVFDVPNAEVSGALRRKAKAINFGIIYGISQYGLARQLNIGNEEAKDYIMRYLGRYPEIITYMEDSKAFAHYHHYVETWAGRRCYMDGITSSNKAVQSFAERAAINAPIQGGAADIMKIAMIKLSEFLNTTSSSLILQVHDEVIIESPASESQRILEECKRIMEEAVKLDIPLQVDGNIGETWADIH